MVQEAVVLGEQVTYAEAERLCIKHITNRARPDLHGRTVQLIRWQPEQRFKPATPSVSRRLFERIEFDRAFRMLDKHHQKVLLGWYGRVDIKPEELAKSWGVDRATVYRRKHRAVQMFAEVLTKCDWQG